MEWINAKENLPKLPNSSYCAVIVIACIKGEKDSLPMIYERSVVRGKAVERWRYYRSNICDLEVTHWQPLPKPPKE